MKHLFLLLLLPAFSYAQSFSRQELDRYEKETKQVTIVRDNWGIPHVYGKTDAAAVFGLLYAQCEDNFPRVERNYLEIMGRLSEVEGKAQLYDDLEMRLIYDSTAARKDYQRCPEWFRHLLDAFADAVNYYLFKHPSVHPKVLKHFEAWFPLMYTDGSIAPTQDGGLRQQDIRNLYRIEDLSATSFTERKMFREELDPSGSNGFALAPSKTASGNAMLYINPHVTFYFREEAQMVSDEGLNAYGAVTWGQFFIYQGFNAHCGWMHTSSYADVADLYREKIDKKQDHFYYEYDGKQLPVASKPITILYRVGDHLQQEHFQTYATQHGPVMGARDGQWLSLKENNRSLNALMQSWLRTKANGFPAFRKVMDLRSNNSNNTVFADDKGNIAYWHGNFVPRRDQKFNWSLPVDGSTSATEWKGIHALDEIVHVYNPASGFIQNCNSTPFTCSGASSPKKDNYPYYMAPDGQNARAVNAERLLSKASKINMEDLIHKIGYSHYLTAFEILLPPLLKAYDELPASDSLKSVLREPVQLLAAWDRNAEASSVTSTIAIEWAYRMFQFVPPSTTPEGNSYGISQLNAMVSNSTSLQKLHVLYVTLKDLDERFGTWRTGWGEINRYQRSPGSDNQFDDHQPSMAVGQAAATWGSLPSFATRRFPNTNKRYGVSGNSFVCCVEFGKRVKAKSIVTGGESFDPASRHFLDQAPGYIDGNFKEVLFYKEDVMKHAEKTYHPGGF